MNYLTRFTKIFVLFALLYLVLSKKAHAYIDLGTGSYILQLIIAFLIAALMLVKSFFKRLINFFYNFSKR
jgi:hypothetical protein